MIMSDDTPDVQYASTSASFHELGGPGASENQGGSRSMTSTDRLLVAFLSGLLLFLLLGGLGGLGFASTLLAANNGLLRGSLLLLLVHGALRASAASLGRLVILWAQGMKEVEGGA